MFVAWSSLLRLACLPLLLGAIGLCLLSPGRAQDGPAASPDGGAAVAEDGGATPAPVPGVEADGVALLDLSVRAGFLRGTLRNGSAQTVEKVWLVLALRTAAGSEELGSARMIPGLGRQVLEPGVEQGFVLDLSGWNLGEAPPLLPGLVVVPVPLGERAHRIVDRAGWSGHWPALRGVSRYQDLSTSLRWIVVHHSNFETPRDVRYLHDNHTRVRGFADIGYHYVIDVHGDIYQGRPLRYMGAHAGQSRQSNLGVWRARRQGLGQEAIDRARQQDPDWGAIGVVVDGDFDAEEPSTAQRQALRWLLEHLRQRFGIPWARVITHREVRWQLVERRGLSFAGSDTRCPGEQLQRHVEALREAGRAAPPPQ